MKPRYEDFLEENTERDQELNIDIDEDYAFGSITAGGLENG